MGTTIFFSIYGFFKNMLSFLKNRLNGPGHYDFECDFDSDPEIIDCEIIESDLEDYHEPDPDPDLELANHVVDQFTSLLKKRKRNNSI